MKIAPVSPLPPMEASQTCSSALIRWAVRRAPTAAHTPPLPASTSIRLARAKNRVSLRIKNMCVCVCDEPPPKTLSCSFCLTHFVFCLDPRQNMQGFAERRHPRRMPPHCCPWHSTSNHTRNNNNNNGNTCCPFRRHAPNRCTPNQSRCARRAFPTTRRRN